jgi:hypothetical protein
VTKIGVGGRVDGMAWMTQMRDYIHLEARVDMSDGIRRARLNRLDNSMRAIARGLGVHRTRTQKNAKRRLRQGR